MIGAAAGTMAIVFAVIGIAINSLFLWLSAAKIFKLKDRTFKKPFTIALIAGIVGFVLGYIPVIRGWIGWVLVSALIIWLIKDRYKTDWPKAVLVWLVYFVLSLIAAFIVLTVIMGGMMGIGGMM
jgi:hypothetical protein